MWLLKEYMPEVVEMDRRALPSLARLSSWLGGKSHTAVVPVARDTPDWTLMSFWAHPERVLDASARAATSGFAQLRAEVVERVVAAVRRDLSDQSWDRRHGRLRALHEYDAGLRLVVSMPS